MLPRTVESIIAAAGKQDSECTSDIVADCHAEAGGIGVVEVALLVASCASM